MTAPLERLKQNLSPLREELISHKLYRSIDSLAALRIFMEQHVFAVWDFMSLLKTLQQRLTCTTVPWTPPENPAAARLVNEIVLGEESDSDQAGGFASRLELYLHAMKQADCATDAIERLIESVKAGTELNRALVESRVSAPARDFVTRTFTTIETGSLVAVASAFTFGREDLLPDLFRQLVTQFDRDDDTNLQPFLYYLDRHIELDEEHHGPMADRLILDLCGDDQALWQEAENAARDALQQRLDLWDCISQEIIATPV